MTEVIGVDLASEPDRGIVKTCCPKCHGENFIVQVTDSGSGPDEWGTCYWFGGDGKCLDCGHEQYYSDSNH